MEIFLAFKYNTNYKVHVSVEIKYYLKYDHICKIGERILKFSLILVVTGCMEKVKCFKWDKIVFTIF